MWLFIQKFIAYGCIGIFIEFLFTSVASLLQRNWKATGCSYIWMVPVYGSAAVALEVVSSALPWPFWAKAFVYVPLIYGIEALSGASIAWVTKYLEKWFGGHGGGVVPWDYGKSHWTPMGLINLKYAPFWLVLAMAFDPISGYLRKVLNFLAKME